MKIWVYGGINLRGCNRRNKMHQIWVYMATKANHSPWTLAKNWEINTESWATL